MSGVLTSVKKTWNSGIISGCQYMQQNIDLKMAGQVALDKAKDAFTSLVWPSESSEVASPPSGESTSSEDKS